MLSYVTGLIFQNSMAPQITESSTRQCYSKAEADKLGHLFYK